MPKRMRPWVMLTRCLRSGAAAALLAMAAGISASSELTIAVSRSSLSLPLWVADELRLFAAEGLAAKTRECLGGHRCIKQMLDGEVSLATSSEMPIMVNSLDGADFAVVATFAASKRDVKLVARKSAAIAGARDLVGKRVGTMGGTSAHYFLDLYLLFNGIDPKAVTVVLLDPEQMVTAMREGTVDALATFEPFAYRSMLALGDDGILLPTARIYSETFNLSAKRKLIAEREADLVKLMRALAKAQRFIHENPQRAKAILKDRMQEDQGYIDATWSDFEYRVSLDQPLISTLEGQARWAIREGYMPRGRRIANFLHYVAPEPLRKADPAAVTLVK
jgi:ABC-type nitrate/sulfonate/bicarbonate transport system substrate-binding protein